METKSHKKWRQSDQQNKDDNWAGVKSLTKYYISVEASLKQSQPFMPWLRQRERKMNFSTQLSSNCVKCNKMFPHSGSEEKCWCSLMAMWDGWPTFIGNRFFIGPFKLIWPTEWEEMWWWWEFLLFTIYFETPAQPIILRDWQGFCSPSWVCWSSLSAVL